MARKIAPISDAAPAPADAPKKYDARWMSAALRTHHLPPRIRSNAERVLTAEDGAARMEALEKVIDRARDFKGGHPRRYVDEAKARAAYERARRNGDPVESAVAAAMAAGHFSRARVFALKKAQGWGRKSGLAPF